MPEDIQIVFWFLLLLIPAYYLGMPLVIRFQQRVAAHPNFTPLDFYQLSPVMSQFLMSRTKCLFDMGFEEPTLVQVPNAVPHVSAYLIMLVNRPAGDKAMVSVVVSEQAAMQACMVEFNTRWDTGQVFNTHNIPELLWPPEPMSVRTQVPSLQDPRKLYQLHTFIMNKHGLAGKKVLYGPEEALDYLARFAFREPCEEKVRRGWYYFDPAKDCYRPTLKGAYLLTWGLMQPFKAFRKLALLRRERKTLEEFEQAGGS